MQISIITTVTINTPYRKDPWRESLQCYLDFADEVIVVCGHQNDLQEIGKAFPVETRDAKLKMVYMKWPYKWDWSQLPNTMNRALKLATGDVILRFDIDYFIHENDFDEFKEQLSDFYTSNKPIGKTLKVNIFNKYQGLIKSRNPNVIHGGWKHKIRFGEAKNKKTDWTVPTINWGNCKSPNYLAMEEEEMPLLRTWIYNYDYFFCTEEDVKEEFWRFAQAYATAFDNSWGKTKEEAWSVWKNMMTGRLRRAGEEIESHPKWIAKKIDELDNKQWGKSNFNFV